MYIGLPIICLKVLKAPVSLLKHGAGEAWWDLDVPYLLQLSHENGGPDIPEGASTWTVVGMMVRWQLPDLSEAAFLAIMRKHTAKIVTDFEDAVLGAEAMTEGMPQDVRKEVEDTTASSIMP